MGDGELETIKRLCCQKILATLNVLYVKTFKVASIFWQHNLFIVSGSPSNPILREVTQMLCWGHNSLGVSAASQQTLFIVSGSPSNPILGEVTQMLFWGNNSHGG